MVILVEGEDKLSALDLIGSIAEAAAIADVSKSFIHDLIRYDRIAARQSGKVWLVDLVSLAHYMEGYQQNAKMVDV